MCRCRRRSSRVVVGGGGVARLLYDHTLRSPNQPPFFFLPFRSVHAPLEVSVVIITSCHLIMIMIALTGANRDFLQFLTAPRTDSNTHVQLTRCNHVCKSCTTHRALITCNTSCATWCEGAAQLLSLTELKSHLF